MRLYIGETVPHFGQVFFHNALFTTCVRVTYFCVFCITAYVETALLGFVSFCFLTCAESRLIPLLLWHCNYSAKCHALAVCV